MDNISVLYNTEEIACAVKKLGSEISNDYKGGKLLVVSVLKGSVVFVADLIRCIDSADVRLTFIRAKSYEGCCSSGNVSILNTEEISQLDMSEYDVLVAEDILDTGLTLDVVKKYLLSLGAKSVKIAAFMDKPSRRVNNVKADYSCFEIEDRFVVGYGLDYNEKYRHLPYVGEVIL